VTTSDVSNILEALADLGKSVANVLERLVRIEERTSVLNDHESRIRASEEMTRIVCERTTVLTDHELRIRAAEEAARVAGETAVQAKGVAEAQAVRIRLLEDAGVVAGKFTLSTFAKVIIGASTVAVGVMMIAAAMHNW